jgi:acyl carrier protein
MSTHHQVILKAINEVLKESGRSERSDVTENCYLKRDLDLDSLDLAVLTVKIEAETGVDVFADGIVETVGQICARLER